MFSTLTMTLQMLRTALKSGREPKIQLSALITSSTWSPSLASHAKETKKANDLCQR